MNCSILIFRGKHHLLGVMLDEKGYSLIYFLLFLKTAKNSSCGSIKGYAFSYTVETNIETGHAGSNPPSVSAAFISADYLCLLQ